MTHSEIVLATSPSLDEPFQFEKVVISNLITTAKAFGADRLTGGKTWNMIQKIKQPK